MVAQLCDKFASQGWINLFFDIENPSFESEMVEFYMNLAFVEGDVAISRVHGADIVFDKEKLGQIHVVL